MGRNSVENGLVLIAAVSTNDKKYSHRAAKLLADNGFKIAPLGFAKGEVGGVEIQSLSSEPKLENVHTITLYMRPENQKEWYDYFLSLSPKRIVFNPGTENSELSEIARDKGIEVVYDCTLQMVRRDDF